MALFENFENVRYGTQAERGSVRGASDVYDDNESLIQNFAQLGGETKMFALDRVNYAPSASILKMAVENGVIVMALENGSIVCIDLDNPHEIEEISVAKRGQEQFHNIFLDPTGKHLIICLDTKETYYLNSGWPAPRKPKLLLKMKGVLAESVAWDEHSNATCTGEILI